MSASRDFVSWANYNKSFAERHGCELSLFVMPKEAKVALFQDAVRSHLEPHEYRVDGKHSYLCNVKVLWTTKLPPGTAWFMYTKQPDQEKEKAA